MFFLDGLTESQREAVTHPGGPLLVLAGAGSGKTRVITTRIAYLVKGGVAPHRVVAVTFTNKAAGEMRERAASLLGSSLRGLTLCTFHSFCARLLRRFADRLGYGRDFSILDDRASARVFKSVMKDLEVPGSQFKPSGVAETVSKIKNSLETPETYLEFADGYRRQIIGRIYKAYQAELLGRNCMDFDDLLANVATLLAQDKEACELYQDRILHLLVDEYQDTNRAQYVIAKLLSEKHRNICVAGDPDQSIYRWRGAELSNILDFEKDFPDTTVVRLEENWRSCGAVLKNAQSVIQNNTLRKEKTLKPTREMGPNVRLVGCYDEVHEARMIAETVKSLSGEDLPYSGFAVLYRTNAFSRALEEAFSEAKIPYQVVQGTEFYRRREIRDLVSYLDVLVNTRNDFSMGRILNTPPRGLGKKARDSIKAIAKKDGVSLFDALKSSCTSGRLGARATKKAGEFLKLLEDLRAGLDGKPVGVLKEIIARTGYEEYILRQDSGQDRWENIRELLKAARRFSIDNPGAGLADYVEQVALVADIDGYESQGKKVSLMTLHAVKGLEFPVVFIAGLEEGLIPHRRSVEDGRLEELEEERRLLYVGMTRAKDHLHLSLAKYRTEFGGPLRQVESRFLGELDMNFTDLVDRSEEY